VCLELAIGEIVGDGWWTGKDLEGSGRRLIGELSGIYLDELRTEPLKAYQDAGVPDEIRTQYVLNTSSHSYHEANQFGISELILKVGFK
jgi:hypothetical protein